MAKKIYWRDRLEWAESLPLPDRLTLILVYLVKEADINGTLPFLLRKLDQQTRFDRDELQRALDYFLTLGLLLENGIDERWDAPRYKFVHGAAIDPLQLTLGMHGMLSAIEQLTDIEDRHQLALEKLVIRHYDWPTGLVTATTEQLMRLSPRWSQQKTNKALEELMGLGHLRRAPGEQRGFGRTPHKYLLEIRTNSPEIPYKSDQLSPEIPYKSDQLSPEIPYKSDQLSPEIPYKSDQLSPEIPYKSGLHPYTEDSPKTLLVQTPPPPTAAAVQTECSKFWASLMSLDEAAAFALLRLKTMERDNQPAWHEVWADKALEDLDEVLDKRGITDPAGAVIKRFRDPDRRGLGHDPRTTAAARVPEGVRHTTQALPLLATEENDDMMLKSILAARRRAILDALRQVEAALEHLATVPDTII